LNFHYIGKKDIRELLLRCPDVEQSEEHFLTRSPYTTQIPCKYKGIGCYTELVRQEMSAHEQDDEFHLRMALNTVAKLKEESVTLKKQNRSMTFVLSDYQKKKDANSTYIFSNQPFYTHSNGYHMTLRVDANGYGDGKGRYVSVYVQIVKGDYDAKLQWPFVGRMTLTLLNQLEDKSHYTLIIPFTSKDGIRVGNAWGFHQFVLHSALAHDPVKNTQYLKDDTLYFSVSGDAVDHRPWLE
jgi:TNF receptor-associated factor 4